MRVRTLMRRRRRVSLRMRISMMRMRRSLISLPLRQITRTMTSFAGCASTTRRLRKMEGLNLNSKNNATKQIQKSVTYWVTFRRPKPFSQPSSALNC